MDRLKYFFRGIPDGYYFVPFTLQHFLILMVVALGAALIIKHRDSLTQTRRGSLLRALLASLLLLQQMILYFWYGFSGYFSLQEGLPLYNCRFAILCAALALLSRKKVLQAIACYWGVFAAIMALVHPALDPFAFPHYTNFSFFGGHALLLWTACYLLFVDHFEPGKWSLQFMLSFTTLYHLAVYLFNRVTQSNYCYLIKAPFAATLFSKMMPGVTYTLAVILIWNLLILLFHRIAVSVYTHMEKQDQLMRTKTITY